MLLIKRTATPSPFCTQAAAGADLKPTFPNQLCVTLAYANLRREDDSRDPKFHDATFQALTNPRLGTTASLVRWNAGSGRLAGAGRRNCKQWRPGLPRPSAPTESQPRRRRTPARDAAYRNLDPSPVPRSPRPVRSSPLASEGVRPAWGGRTSTSRAPRAPEGRGLGLTQLAREKTPRTAPMVTPGPRPTALSDSLRRG